MSGAFDELLATGPHAIDGGFATELEAQGYEPQPPKRGCR